MTLIAPRTSNGWQARQFKDRSNLYSPFLGTGNASCDFDRLIEICRVDQEEATKLFACFRKGAVRDVALAVTNTNAGRGRHRMQRGSATILPLSVEVMRQFGGLHKALLACTFGP